MKSITVIVASEFPASTEKIWERLMRLETLRYIASPYAMFKSVGETGVIWEQGRKSRLKLKVFSFIPMGTHTINVIQFDKSALSVYTNESNKVVPVWNHTGLKKLATIRQFTLMRWKFQRG